MSEIEQLQTKLLRIAPKAGMYNSLTPGLAFSRRHEPTETQRCFYRPMVIIILQGKKQIIVGMEELIFQEGDCIVASVDIPMSGRILEASSTKPFLALILELDVRLIVQLLSEMPVQHPSEPAERAIEIMPAGEDLPDAFTRLLNLEDTPERRQIMAPLLIKEIHYLLLLSPLGRLLRAVNTVGTNSNHIAQAIGWLKEHYNEPLKIAELSRQCHMASSSFYRNFSQITGLSPLQYQKMLRLCTAQQLMLSEQLSVERVAYRVGYESSSQFNREYKRMFGQSPKMNIKQFKTA